jgi:ketosteroid isomerase-like protein
MREQAMSAATIALVQGLYSAFGRGDVAAVIAGCTADVDWEVNGRRKDYPLFGSWKGTAEVRKFFETLGRLQEVTDFSPREFFAVEDRVFVLGFYACKVRSTGRAVASDWVHIFTIRGGKVAAFRDFLDTAQLAEAARG